MPNVPKRNRDSLEFASYAPEGYVPNVPKRNRDGIAESSFETEIIVPNVPKRNRDTRKWFLPEHV